MSSKQICIRTWYGTDNYGSNLQAIGLSQTLSDLGFDVYFLKNFMVLPFMIKHPIMLLARLEHYLNRKRTSAFFVPVKYQISEKRKEKLKRFKSSVYKEKNYTDPKKWEEAIKDQVIFVAGSDILWNPAKGYPGTNFLDFAYYAKLNYFSYASSIGATQLPKQYYRAYRRYLGGMKKIGVREESVVSLLEPILHKKVEQVIDPTLLLDKEYWSSFSEKADPYGDLLKEDYILAYFVMNDPRYWEYIKKVSDECKMKVVVLPMHSLDEEQPYEIILDGTPYEFVSLIRHAQFICTDSFHACVLSMIFHKEFYLLRRQRRAEDAKYNDFLGRYQLMDRIIEDETVFTRKPVHYDFADGQLDLDRKHAMNFLKEALNECSNEKQD